MHLRICRTPVRMFIPGWPGMLQPESNSQQVECGGAASVEIGQRSGKQLSTHP